MNRIMRKSMSTLVIQPRFRALGQMHVKWQTFEKPEMYGSQAWVDWLPYICLFFCGFSNVCHFTCILPFPKALKLGCIANVNMLFLSVMGFTCLFYENKFMLISGGHISNRSILSSWKWTMNMTATTRNLEKQVSSYHGKNAFSWFSSK